MNYVYRALAVVVVVGTTAPDAFAKGGGTGGGGPHSAGHTRAANGTPGPAAGTYHGSYVDAPTPSGVEHGTVTISGRTVTFTFGKTAITTKAYQDAGGQLAFSSRKVSGIVARVTKNQVLVEIGAGFQGKFFGGSATMFR